MTDDDDRDPSPTIGRRVARFLGAALGGVMPELDVSKVDKTSEHQREFVDAFEEAKAARFLGELMRAAARPKRKPKKDETEP
jgi:hypothetical protein